MPQSAGRRCKGSGVAKQRASAAKGKGNPRATPPPGNRGAKKGAVPVMLVDDHPMWRQTLRKVIEGSRAGEVVAEAESGEEAVRLAKAAKPRVVVMDLGLPEMTGIEATRRILEVAPNANVLVLSASEDRSDVVAAMHAGASGYLPKTAVPTELSEAIGRLDRGELVLPPALAEIVLEELRGGEPLPTLRVVLADPSALFRDGLGRMLSEHGFDVIARVGKAEELLAVLSSEVPDVVVTDVRLPSRSASDGADIAGELKRSHPGVGVLLLSQDIDVQGGSRLISEAPKGVGYLLKDRVTDVIQLGEAIRRVAGGESVLDPEVAGRLVRPRKERDPLDDLTPREREVLGLMAEGRSNQAISERLFLSGKAVEGHVRNIFAKLNLEPAADDHRRVLAVIAFLRSV
jgi:DNA-binding NarL/FixJ family response regulator